MYILIIVVVFLVDMTIMYLTMKTVVIFLVTIIITRTATVPSQSLQTLLTMVLLMML